MQKNLYIHGTPRGSVKVYDKDHGDEKWSSLFLTFGSELQFGAIILFFFSGYKCASSLFVLSLSLSDRHACKV